MTLAESIRRRKCRFIMKSAWRYYKRVQNIDFSLALKSAWQLITGRVRPHHSKVRGVSFGNRQKAIQSLIGLNEDDYWLEFVREPDNPLDESAIIIRVFSAAFSKGNDIGYVSYELSQQIAPQLDAGSYAVVLLNDITGQHRVGGFLGVNYEYIII